MPLTPQDVHTKVFGPTRFRRGYDEGEVDSFLDEVEVELTRLYREIESLRSRLGDPTSGASTGATGTESEATETDARAGQQPSDAGQEAGLGTASAPGPMESAETSGAPGSSDPVEAELVEPSGASSGEQMPRPAVQTGVQPANAGDAGEPADLEQRVARALVLAQRAADEAIADAERQAEELRAAARAEADRIRREAEAEADRMRGELERSRSDAEGEVEQLRAFEREYRTRLRAYLQLQLNELETGRSGGQEAASLGGGGGDQAGIAAGVTEGAGTSTESHGVAVAPPVTSDSPETDASSPDVVADSDRWAGVSRVTEGQELRHEPRGLHDDL